KRPTIEQRTKKDREESSFEQLNLPTVAVPNLADVNDRHIHPPQHCEQNRVGVTAEDDQREREADPSEDRHPQVGATKPEQSRQLEHSFRARTELRMNVVQIIVRRC